jgi:hypothetical protein
MTMMPATRAHIDVSNYKEEVLQRMQEAWKLARKSIKAAQRRQKIYYDRHTREPTFRPGDRVFLYTSSAKAGPAYKFALPYKEPYRVIEVNENVACLQLISHPSSDVIRVSISRLRHCPVECLQEQLPAAQLNENTTENTAPEPSTNEADLADCTDNSPLKYDKDDRTHKRCSLSHLVEGIHTMMWKCGTYLRNGQTG